MSGQRAVDRAAAWIYSGIWAVIVDWFRVPPSGPAIPSAGRVEVFHPAPGFLSYLKFWFWIGLVAIDAGIAVGWIAITVAHPIVGVVLAPVAVVLAVVPDVLAFVAIHLRYDTTWYALSERSMRIRRGIWLIHEVTITYENVQNVKVRSGPVQRAFGIADVIVETAGAGGNQQNKGGGVTNRGLIEGVGDAERIRDLIMSRVRRSRSAGLGDEPDHAAPIRTAWSPEHVAVLQQIRDAVAASGR